MRFLSSLNVFVLRSLIILVVFAGIFGHDHVNAGWCSWAASRLQFKGYEFSLDNQEIQKTFLKFSSSFTMEVRYYRPNLDTSDFMALQVLHSASLLQIYNSKNPSWDFIRKHFLGLSSKYVESSNVEVETTPRGQCAVACHEAESRFDQVLFEQWSQTYGNFVAIYLPGIKGPVAIKKGRVLSSRGENTLIALQNVYSPKTDRFVLIKGGIYQVYQFHKNYDSKKIIESGIPFQRVEIQADEVFSLSPVRMFLPHYIGKFNDDKKKEVSRGKNAIEARKKFNRALDVVNERFREFGI